MLFFLLLKIMAECLILIVEVDIYVNSDGNFYESDSKHEYNGILEISKISMYDNDLDQCRVSSSSSEKHDFLSCDFAKQECRKSYSSICYESMSTLAVKAAFADRVQHESCIGSIVKSSIGEGPKEKNSLSMNSRGDVVVELTAKRSGNEHRVDPDKFHSKYALSNVLAAQGTNGNIPKSSSSQSSGIPARQDMTRSCVMTAFREELSDQENYLKHSSELQVAKTNLPSLSSAVDGLTEDSHLHFKRILNDSPVIKNENGNVQELNDRKLSNISHETVLYCNQKKDANTNHGKNCNGERGQNIGSKIEKTKMSSNVLKERATTEVSCHQKRKHGESGTLNVRLKMPKSNATSESMPSMKIEKNFSDVRKPSGNCNSSENLSATGNTSLSHLPSKNRTKTSEGPKSTGPSPRVHRKHCDTKTKGESDSAKIRNSPDGNKKQMKAKTDYDDNCRPDFKSGPLAFNCRTRDLNAALDINNDSFDNNMNSKKSEYLKENHGWAFKHSEHDYVLRKVSSHPDGLKYARLIHVEQSANGGASLVHSYQEEIDCLSPTELSEFVREYFQVVFEEHSGISKHVMGIVHGSASFLPDLLEFFADSYGEMIVKRGVLGKSDIDTTSMADFRSSVHSTYSAGTYRCGPLLQLSLVGTKAEESGGYFPEFLHLIEESPFLRVVMPWGELSEVCGLEPNLSNDGPILWSRPGEQVVPTADLPKSPMTKKRFKTYTEFFNQYI